MLIILSWFYFRSTGSLRDHQGLEYVAIREMVIRQLKHCVLVSQRCEAHLIKEVLRARMQKGITKALS